MMGIVSSVESKILFMYIRVYLDLVYIVSTGKKYADFVSQFTTTYIITFKVPM